MGCNCYQAIELWRVCLLINLFISFSNRTVLATSSFGYWRGAHKDSLQICFLICDGIRGVVVMCNPGGVSSVAYGVIICDLLHCVDISGK